MNKTPFTRALVVAGVLAAAGAAAQANETADVPLSAGEHSTMTNGVPNAYTTNSPYGDAGSSVVVVDTRTLGAGPTVLVERSTYVVPHAYEVPGGLGYQSLADSPRGYASATTSIPDRAGEASTFTGGAPNLLP